MNGVTILYTELVEATYGPGWDFWGALLGLLGVMCLVIACVFAARLHVGVIALLGACVLFLGTSSLIRLTNSVVEVPEHYEYKVLIDDSVSPTEFNEKYEIINREGAIYTIVERGS